MIHKGELGGEVERPLDDQFGGRAEVPDVDMLRMLEATNLIMRQQQVAQQKEVLATKALHSIVNQMDQFDGQNVSKYLSSLLFLRFVEELLHDQVHCFKHPQHINI